MKAAPLTQDAFAPFGEVNTCSGDFSLINAGQCKRYTDLASFDVIDGNIGLSLFHSELRQLPYTCDLLERHPLGSQCFIPMGDSDFLVIVAEDENGPVRPKAFHARADQTVNIARNTWHGVLAPISGTGQFAVLDRIGEGANLEEVHLQEPLIITV